ncbi:MAG: bifunctional histidinol-phosphatase/imidazoleglycerol-phosphate dehydratase HisB [Ignavibacteriales bacterium]|nr:bifunctional histidinol-phosphatase/imidazoleglycerol-phosphate dehydratase HisB [Ignavibacteriales bacterium]
MKVVFLDRDGTLIAEPPDKQIDSLDKLELIPGVVAGLRPLVEAGFELVMVTNQDGLGTKSFPRESFEMPQQKLLRLLEGEGIRFNSIFVCPHRPADQCNCRKPKTGMITEFLARNRIDLANSFVIGDRETDVEFAKNLGCRSVRLLTGEEASNADYAATSFRDACRFVLRGNRSGSLRRKANETTIDIRINLDGTGTYNVHTGIGFFDHMLTQLSKHSLIDMDISVKGDLDVDEHHTVEDTGLALGSAILQALDDKKGIERYGFLLPARLPDRHAGRGAVLQKLFGGRTDWHVGVPMDESLAKVALDIGGRPYLSFEGRFERERVGELPTELVEDFFRAFADGLRANLHISVEGRNDHHKIEAIFKSVARALKQAVSLDGRAPDILPTTKGTL